MDLETDIATTQKKGKTKITTSPNPTKQDILASLIETAIPCMKVLFQTTVNSPLTGDPEYIYYDLTSKVEKRQRLGSLYLTPHFVIIVQGAHTTIVPSANVKQATPK